MKICDILRLNKIVPSLKSKSKKDVINELVDLFADDDRVTDLEKVRVSVWEREKIMSTGVGKGFAIPHVKTDAVDEIVAAFGKLSSPIDFEALDNKPVNLIFLLIGKENLVGPHIKLLSRISRMMNNDKFRNKLSEADSAEDIYKLICEEEEKFDNL